MAPVLGADGKPLAARRWYDTESIAEDGGTVWVGIERVHRIVRFDYARHGLLARGQPITVPPAFARLPNNKGIECLVFVPKGALARTLLAISERGLDAAGNIKGFLIGGPGPGEFSIKRIGEFDVSDCAITPGGDLLLLERSFATLRGVGHAHPPRAARRREAGCDGRRPGADRGRHGLPDRQHGRPVGAPRGRRRAGADADLGRQFLDAAAHAAVAVHAGGAIDLALKVPDGILDVQEIGHPLDLLLAGAASLRRPAARSSIGWRSTGDCRSISCPGCSICSPPCR
jgi:hypothetical protein